MLFCCLIFNIWFCCSDQFWRLPLQNSMGFFDFIWNSSNKCTLVLLFQIEYKIMRLINETMRFQQKMWIFTLYFYTLHKMLIFIKEIKIMQFFIESFLSRKYVWKFAYAGNEVRQVFIKDFLGLCWIHSCIMCSIQPLLLCRVNWP